MNQSIARAALALALTTIVLVASGCRPATRPSTASSPASNAPGGPRSGASTETLRGTLRILGAQTQQDTWLEVDGAPQRTLLFGPASMRTVAGLSVAVTGQRTLAGFVVTDFSVTTANGVAATEGTIAVDGNAVYLLVRGGVRVPLLSPSNTLRAAVGRRVWVSGPLNAVAVAYGIID